MDALFVAQGRDRDSRSGLAPDRKWSPVVFALDRLFPKRGKAPYATAERVVVLVIIRAMSFDEREGAFNCFLSYPTIAKWSGVSLASLKRALQKHSDGPAPLIGRSKPGHTRGYPHACYRFTLVRHPEKFAAARDDARAERRKEVDGTLRDLQPDRIALQRQRQDLGGTLTNAEYDASVRALLGTSRTLSATFPPDSRQGKFALGGGFTVNDRQFVDPILGRFQNCRIFG
jgi:DNA-binding transcriptional MerR regulator